MVPNKQKAPRPCMRHPSRPDSCHRQIIKWITLQALSSRIPNEMLSCYHTPPPISRISRLKELLGPAPPIAARATAGATLLRPFSFFCPLLTGQRVCHYRVSGG